MRDVHNAAVAEHMMWIMGGISMTVRIPGSGVLRALGLILSGLLFSAPAAAQDCRFYDGTCRFLPCALVNDCAALGGNYAGSFRSCGLGSLGCEALCNRPYGFHCNGLPSGECDLQDVCSGDGTCIINVKSDGFPCGSSLDDECTDPDTCQSGRCAPNNVLAGLECPAGFCTNSGVCGAASYALAQGTITDPIPGSSPGDKATLEFAFSPSGADGDPDPQVGQYSSLISAQLSFGVNRWVWYGVSGAIGTIRIANGSTDTYELSLYPLFDGGTFHYLDIRLDDPTGSAFSSDHLPATPPDLAAFASREVVFDSGHASLDRFEIDTCPFYYTSNNDDFDHNGIGNECECGDQTQDGTVNVLDIIAINAAIFGSVQVSPLCDTNYDGKCDVRDIVGANNKIFGRPAYCSRYPPPPAP